MKRKITFVAMLIVFIWQSSEAQQFEDHFSGTLSAWTDMYGSDWTIQNNELHGFFSLWNGSTLDHHADLILKDQYQIAGNWKASIDFIRVADDEFPNYFSAFASFSLWSSDNKKFTLGFGGGKDFWGGMQDSISFAGQEWNGSWGPNAAVSVQKANFNWNPDQWHRASIEKRGNIYSVFIDDACIGHYKDTFLNGTGKIGLHTYGTKRYDNFKLEPITCDPPAFSDDFSGSLSAWSDMYGGNWSIHNNELHGFYSLTSGGVGDPHADLILKDQYQMSGNWIASIDFMRVVDDEFPTYYSAYASFSLWMNENQKFTIGVGCGGDSCSGIQDSINFDGQEWSGSWGPSAFVSTGKARFHWDPDQWHTASIEKRGNIYSVFVDDACIGHYVDNFLNGMGKIGLQTYGTKRYDNFRLKRCSNLPPFVGMVDHRNLSQEIILSPNPTKDLVYLTAGVNQDLIRVEIIDAQGKVLMIHECADGTSSMNLGNLQIGIYLVKIITRNGTFFKKVIRT